MCGTCDQTNKQAAAMAGIRGVIIYIYINSKDVDNCMPCLALSNFQCYFRTLVCVLTIWVCKIVSETHQTKYSTTNCMEI